MTAPTAHGITVGRHRLSAALPDDPQDDNIWAMSRVLTEGDVGAEARDPRLLDDRLILPVHQIRTASTPELEAIIAYHDPAAPDDCRYPKTLGPRFAISADRCAVLLWWHIEMVCFGLNPNHLLAMDARVPARFPTLTLILALAAGLAPDEVTEATEQQVDELRSLAMLRGYRIDACDLIGWYEA